MTRVSAAPYGIRESTERVGTTKESKSSEDEAKQQASSHHFPSKISYGLSEIYRDLIDFAVSHLVVGGRLVFWLPVFREDYKESHIPGHPCLELVHNCEQVLTVNSSRRLVTLIKTRHPQAGEFTRSQVTDLTATFREKFFQSTLLTKEERASLKSLFSRDKRGQGLAYRLNNTKKNQSKAIEMDEALECESSGVMEEKSSELYNCVENMQEHVSGKK